MVAKRPVLIECGLGFRAIGDDAFFVAFTADAEHALFLLDVGEVEAGEFADAKAGGIEQFEECAVAAKQQALVFEFGKTSRGCL